MEPGTVSGSVELSGFKRNPAIEEAPLGDELMLFDPGSSKFFVLNRTMAFVWRRCGQAVGLDDMIDALDREFDGVDRERARADLEEAVHELTSYGLVVSDAANP